MRCEAKKLLLDGAFIPAMPLVPDENRRFDEVGQRRLIRYYLAAGADGIDTAHQFAGCIAGGHEVLRRQGLMRGIGCLDPHETLSPNQAEEITRMHDMYPHLHDDAFVAVFLAEDAKSPFTEAAI